ncbi:TRF-like 2 [Salvia divinorum]|uniref:TRF-like 2 n=1 Tax=Salvia divinorum TaxID=28513 RepID=A0ABD1GQE7_SALDI
MALQKRLEYGFNGYQMPPTPRAARSVRRRSLFKRKPDDNQMCPFDLFATVAGKLLLDGKSPPSGKEQPPALGNAVGKGDKDEDKPLEEKHCGRDCYERNFLFTDIVSEAPNPNSRSNELACAQNVIIPGPASGITSSDCSEKFGCAEQLANDDCKLSLGISTPSVDIESSGLRLSANSGSEDESRKDIKLDCTNIRNLSISNKVSLCNSVHPEASNRKSSSLLCSVDSVKFPFCRDRAPFPVNRENVKLVSRDDDDNSSECIEPSTRDKALKPPGDRRFRKFVAPKHCKITSNVKDGGGCNAERCNYLNRKNGFKRQRSLRDYPFKKRKLYDGTSVSNSDERITGDGMFEVSENGANEDGLRSCPPLPGAKIAPASTAGGYESFQFHSRNSQVKLRIKSFKVLELFIEIPETATVGSLKHMVMEAVNTVLGGGLHVGVTVKVNCCTTDLNHSPGIRLRLVSLKVPASWGIIQTIS